MTGRQLTPLEHAALTILLDLSVKSADRRGDRYSNVHVRRSAAWKLEDELAPALAAAGMPDLTTLRRQYAADVRRRRAEQTQRIREQQAAVAAELETLRRES